MPSLSLRRALAPLLGLVDRSATAPHRRPDPFEEGTNYPQYPWDLRTIIIVFPPAAPFRFLNLNLLLGLTGVPFDQVERLPRRDAREVFDLQFCLEGRERYALYKQYHSIARELKYRPKAVEFRLGERLRFEGRWPAYRILYRQAEIGLSLSMSFDSWEDFHWWAYTPGMYCHYTSFGECEIHWQWNDDSGKIKVPALHDHGWGKNLLPLRLPLKVFRYEVLRLPDAGPEGSDGIAVSLWTEGPLGLELKMSGLHRWDQSRSRLMERYDCQVLEWDEFENYAGRPCRVPRRWLGRQKGKEEEFVYEALRSTDPRAILGNGFIYGFDYQGEWAGSGNEKVEGEGYVEQLGFLKA